MRARTLRHPARRRLTPAATPISTPRRPTLAALVFLRGCDADARLRELSLERAAVRPALGELARAFASRRGYEALGFRSLADWSRERLGVGARSVREWARVGRALSQLPLLRNAVRAGTVSWTVARKIVAKVTPETEAACLDTVRGRTVRAVEALLRAVDAEEESVPTEADGDRVAVRVRCAAWVATKWAAALELARRMAGEALPVWECAEAIAAECASAVGAVGAVEQGAAERAEGPVRAGSKARPLRAGPDPEAERAEAECGLRERLWPRLRWKPRSGHGRDHLYGLTRDLEACSARELDRRLRAAIAFLQRVDFEMGRILKQVLDRRLYRELGFERFDRFVEERIDVSPRTARRWVRVARAEHGAGHSSRVAIAFREGQITLLQAEVLLRGGTVERARKVTLRRLEDEVVETEVAFSAPREVAALFQALVVRFGLEAMLDHAIATWLRAGRQFRDTADFERDGWRCTVPACSARRNLHSHHIRFRSAGGADAPWNRTTLCAYHHQQGVHGGRISIRGRAPDALVYELGVGRFESGDVKIPEGEFSA